MPFNWEQPDWPQFRYDLGPAQDDMLAFAEKAGQVGGVLRSLPEDTRTLAVIDVMIAEAVKTSEIEGELVSRADVVSSIRNQFKLNRPAEVVTDPASRGVAELMVEVRNSWQEGLSEEGLLAWHRILMQGARSVAVGQWRRHAEPMQVVSGSAADPTVHFEAPPSSRVPAEMADFIAWFNASRDTVRQPPVRAALAHLYFESIHPFEDGNGRIGRTIAEKALSQGLGRPVLLSLSRTIESDKKAYYHALQEAQQANEVTPWLCYFTRVVLNAQIEAEALVNFILRKTKFFDRHKAALNERQLKVIRRILDEGPQGFKGGINARKYVRLTKVSKATATRDLQDLARKNVLVALGGGRSTRYELILPPLLSASNDPHQDGVTPYDLSLHSEERVVGPGFHAQVHDLVCTVPAGRVTTYGDVAEALGSRRVARHVGYALAALPEGSEVPWWRVVAAGGRLSQGSDAAAKQARRLRREGLRITKLQVRDFEDHRHGW